MYALLIGCVVLTQAGDELSCPAARTQPTSLKLDEARAKAAHHRAAKVMHPGKRGAAFDPKYAASQYHQDATLVNIFDAIGVKSRYFAEWGSRRPNILNSAHFRKHCNWCGLLLDGSPGASPNGGSMHYPEGLALLNAPNSSCSRLRQAFITPENVNAVLASHNVPAELDLLAVDMDGQDFWVLSAFDFARIRPRVIVVEFSSHFTSHEMCTTRRDAAYVWNFRTDEEVGTALSLLDRLLSCRGYQYITQTAGEHGIWVHRGALSAEDVAAPARLPEQVREGRGFGKERGTHHLKDIVCNVEPPAECRRPLQDGRRVVHSLKSHRSPENVTMCADSRRKFPECSHCINGLVPPTCQLSKDVKRVRQSLRRGSKRRSAAYTSVAQACARWPYLSRDELTTRHIVTAHWMRSLQSATILDIGAYSNPISNFHAALPEGGDSRRALWRARGQLGHGVGLFVW